MKKIHLILFLLSSVLIFESCDFLFGSKEDPVVIEIFEEGSIDPSLIPSEVGYVPIFPFWTEFSSPEDIYIGYDEMVYVIDDDGLKVLDLKGELQSIIPIPGATDVTQDRRLHTYVAGRIDIDVDGDGVTENLAAIYHIENASNELEPIITDTLIHPFSDDTRGNSAFRGADDELVRFTGVATLADNTLLVSRSGPRNDLANIARPDNTILFYDGEGVNVGYANGLNPVSSSLKSVLDVGAVASFAGPPQQVAGISSSKDFIVLQQSEAAEYAGLWIMEFFDPESGTEYIENATLTFMDADEADRFMYEPFRFSNAADVCIAPNESGYIFIVDSELDSLYQFTPNGNEGVNPPPTSTSDKQILVSFGGEGNGPFNFNAPSGVAFMRDVIYVADKGNNRICRFILSTDIE